MSHMHIALSLSALIILVFLAFLYAYGPRTVRRTLATREHDVPTWPNE